MKRAISLALVLIMLLGVVPNALADGGKATYCTECGKKLPEGSKFCPYCGTPVQSAPEGTEKIEFSDLILYVPSDWGEPDEGDDTLSFVVREKGLFMLKFLDLGTELPDSAFEVGPASLDDDDLLSAYSLTLSTLFKPGSGFTFDEPEILVIDNWKASIADITYKESQGSFRGKAVTLFKGTGIYFVYAFEFSAFSDEFETEYDDILNSMFIGKEDEREHSNKLTEAQK